LSGFSDFVSEGTESIKVRSNNAFNINSTTISFILRKLIIKEETNALNEKLISIFPIKKIYSKDVGNVGGNRDQKRISDIRLAHVDVSGRDQLFKVRDDRRSIKIVAQSLVNSFLLLSKDLVKFLLKQ